MARTPGGRDGLGQAKGAIATARTAAELRAAQALVLPLEFGLSLGQPAEAIGVSVRWTCALRMRFARVARGEETPSRARGGRQHQNLALEEEEQFLAPFLDRAKTGGILVVSSVRQALEARLGRQVARSSVYNRLHRHGWRKLAPDKRHPQADGQAQEDWKKNSPKPWPGRAPSSRARGRSD